MTTRSANLEEVRKVGDKAIIEGKKALTEMSLIVEECREMQSAYEAEKMKRHNRR